MVELNRALLVVQGSRHRVRLDAWRQQTFTRLKPQARALFELVPADGWSVDFLAPAMPGSPEEVLEKVRSTPVSYLRKDLAAWAGLQRQSQGRVPAWAARLDGEPELFQRLVDVLGHAHQQMLAPYWPRIDRLARADRAVRMHHLTKGGVESLLSHLSPGRIRWNPPVLELLSDRYSLDVHLGGRGLLLIPSLFAASTINSGAEPQPWLTFPLGGDEHVPTLPFALTTATSNGSSQALAALLGRTRAAVLCVIAEHAGCTTTELAHRAAISLASASKHASVLRGAGLTTVRRHRSNVLHAPTSAGIALLNASTGTAGSTPGVPEDSTLPEG